MAKLFTLFVVAVGALGLVAFPLAADDKDLKLEGQYTIVSGEKDGQPIAQTELAGKTVRITAEKITVADKDGKEDMACTYTLDTSKKPFVIRTKGTGSNQGKDHVGIVERTADNQVRIVLSEGAEVPTEFKTKENQKMWVLKPQQQ
jgi:uncharacterized protein (TIGR03067 family)